MNQTTTIQKDNTPFKIIMCVFILIAGAALIISGFFYFTVNKTIQINATITALDKTTATATASYILNSQPYFIDIESSNLNINDTVPIWVRSNNPNIVFLHNQSSAKNGIVAMSIGSLIMFFVLTYCYIKFYHVPSSPLPTPPLPLSSSPPLPLFTPLIKPSSPIVLASKQPQAPIKISFEPSSYKKLF